MTAIACLRCVQQQQQQQSKSNAPTLRMHRKEIEEEEKSALDCTRDHGNLQFCLCVQRFLLLSIVCGKGLCRHLTFDVDQHALTRSNVRSLLFGHTRTSLQLVNYITRLQATLVCASASASVKFATLCGFLREI